MFAWLCARHWDEDEGARERGRIGVVIKSYLIECGRVGRRVGSKGRSVLLQGFNSQSRRGQDAVASDFPAASGTTLNSESVGVRESEMVEGTSDGEITLGRNRSRRKRRTRRGGAETTRKTRTFRFQKDRPFLVRPRVVTRTPQRVVPRADPVTTHTLVLPSLAR